MLKSILVNGKKVPIPVPISSLCDALSWVEETVLEQGHTITRITMNGIEMEEDECRAMTGKLSEETAVEFQIETPFDLMIQSLETIKNMTVVITRCLKPLAVTLWELDRSEVCPEFENSKEDIALVIELIENLRNIDSRFMPEVQIVLHIGSELDEFNKKLLEADMKKDWKNVARILLNDMETPFQNLIDECSSAEGQVYINVPQSGKTLDR